METILSSDFKKVIALLRRHYDMHAPQIANVLSVSNFALKRHPNTSLPPEWRVFNLDINVEHETYLLNYDMIGDIAFRVKDDINKMSNFSIDKVQILPDYENMEITDTGISIILPIFETKRPVC